MLLVVILALAAGTLAYLYARAEEKPRTRISKVDAGLAEWRARTAGDHTITTPDRVRRG